MTAYETYLKDIKEYVIQNDEVIEECKKEIPQHILWSKNVCDALEDKKENAVTKEIDDEFYFTEILVNRLMYFSYLKGAKDINEKSFQKGWDSCRDDVAKKLDFDFDE